MAVTATVPSPAPDLAGLRQGIAGAQRIAAKVRPAALAGERLLPISPALREVIPSGGLQRGSTVVVGSRQASGATTVALELLAGPSVGGFWCAVAGFSGFGALAAAERGIDLARLVVVPGLGPPDKWMQVLATLFDSVDIVLFAPRQAVRQAEGRRLAARSRDRGSVLVVLDHYGRWQGPSDLRCTVTSSQWSGMAQGYGQLAGRSYGLEVAGRGAAARARQAPLRLPA